MPQLPEFNDGRNFGPIQPTGVDINPRAFGRAADAAAEVGSVLNNIGADLVAKRKRAEDVNAAANAHAKDIQDLMVFQSDLALKTPANGAGYADAMRKWSDDRYQSGQKNMPSEEAAMLYRDKALNFFEHHLVQAVGTEHVMRAKAYETDFHANVQRQANLLVQIPSVEYAREMIAANKEQVRQNTGVTVGEEQGKHLSQRVSARTIGISLLDGFLERGNRDPINGSSYFQQGLNLLEGKASEKGVVIKNGAQVQSEDSGMDVMAHDPVLDGLDAHDRAVYMERFIHALKTRREADGAELHRRLQDDLAAQLQGKPTDPSLIVAMNSAVDQKWPGFTPEYRARHWHEHNLAFATSEIVDQMRKANPAQWPGIEAKWGKRVEGINAATATKDPTLEAIRKPNFNEQEVVRYQGMVERARKAIEDERNRDAADYVFREFPYIANRFAGAKTPQDSEKAVDLVLQKQQELGIPVQFQRPVSKSQALELARGVNSDDYSQAAAAVSAIKDKFGKQWGPVYNQLLADGALKSDRQALGLIAYVPDQQQRENLVSSVIYAKDINKSYEQKFLPAERIAHSQQIRQAVEPLVGAMAGVSEEGGGLNIANGLRDAVQKQFEKAMVQPNAPAVSDAIKNAMKVIKTNHNFVTAAGSVVMVPKQIGDTVIDDRIVGAYMESHKQPDALKKLGVTIPAGMSNDMNYNKADPAEKERLYLRHLSNYGYWVGTPQNDGLKLMVHNPDGSWATPTTAGGAPIIVPFTKAIQMDEFTRKHMEPGLIKKTLEKGLGEAIKPKEPAGLDRMKF